MKVIGVREEKYIGKSVYRCSVNSQRNKGGNKNGYNNR